MRYWTDGGMIQPRAMGSERALFSSAQFGRLDLPDGTAFDADHAGDMPQGNVTRGEPFKAQRKAPK